MSESPVTVPQKQHCENHQRCMEMIQAVLDGSATPEEMEHFKNNIESCLPCIEGYQLEKEVKQSISQKVEKKCCPGKTVDDIKKKIGLALSLAALFALQYSIYHAAFTI